MCLFAQPSFVATVQELVHIIFPAHVRQEWSRNADDTPVGLRVVRVVTCGMGVHRSPTVGHAACAMLNSIKDGDARVFNARPPTTFKNPSAT